MIITIIIMVMMMISIYVDGEISHRLSMVTRNKHSIKLDG